MPMDGYFNFHRYEAHDWLARRSFLARWWRVNARDRRWPPPDYRACHRALVSRSEPALARFSPVLLTLEAMPRLTRSGGLAGVSLPPAADEQCVGIVVLLRDDRGPAPVTHLALLAMANDAEVAERLVGAAYEAHPGGILIGPSSLTPRLAGGVLLDHFHQEPPLHSPYNPPYLAEVIGGTLDAVAFERMWFLDCAAAAQSPHRTQSPRVQEFAVERLVGDLQPLVAASWVAEGEAPDAAEIDLALRLWHASPLLGWCALDGDQVVAYVVAQADVGRYMRRIQGGRTLRGRAWQALRTPGAASAGRVLLGGVLPAARRRGVASALIGAVAEYGLRVGWRTMAIGPVVEGGEAAAFLEAIGAAPRQRYARFASGDDGWSML